MEVLLTVAKVLVGLSLLFGGKYFFKPMIRANHLTIPNFSFGKYDYAICKIANVTVCVLLILWAIKDIVGMLTDLRLGEYVTYGLIALFLGGVPVLMTRRFMRPLTAPKSSIWNIRFTEGELMLVSLVATCFGVLVIFVAALSFAGKIDW